jgi:hypothetical protein
MTNNRKTILTLAAVATLAAALAPITSASAHGPFGHGPSGHGGSTFGTGGSKFGGGFGHGAGSGSFGHGGHNTFASRPSWHRPIEIKVGGYDRPRYFAPRIATYAAPTYAAPTYAAPVYAAAPTYTAPRPIVRPAIQAQAAVNGQNAVLVEVPYAQFSMTGEGQWVEQGNNGKTFGYTEDKRDEWSVYLTDASRGVQIQLDLYQKKVFYADRNSPKRPLYPIVSASAQ